MPGGPVVLSWPDVEASADWASAGMNLVIHEFAHKLDMRSGEANGCPPLPAEMPPRSWQKAMNAAFEHFRAPRRAGEDTAIDPYAAESPAEFFAVLSEVFFADPTLLLHEYPKIYELFAWFYRQDPASRTELLLEGTTMLPAGDAPRRGGARRRRDGQPLAGASDRGAIASPAAACRTRAREVAIQARRADRSATAAWRMPQQRARGSASAIDADSRAGIASRRGRCRERAGKRRDVASSRALPPRASAELGEQRVDRRGLALRGAQHVEAHHVAGAFPDRIERRFAIERAAAALSST